MSDINSVVDITGLSGATLRGAAKLVLGADPGKVDTDKVEGLKTQMTEKLAADGKALAFLTSGKLGLVEKADADAASAAVASEEKKVATEAKTGKAPKEPKAPKEKKVKEAKEPKAPRPPAAPRGKLSDMPTIMPISKLVLTDTPPTIRPGGEGKKSNTEVLWDLMKANDGKTYDDFANSVKANEQVKHYAVAGFVQWAFNRKAITIENPSDEVVAAFLKDKADKKSEAGKKAAEAKKQKEATAAGVTATEQTTTEAAAATGPVEGDAVVTEDTTAEAASAE